MSKAACYRVALLMIRKEVMQKPKAASTNLGVESWGYDKPPPNSVTGELTRIG